MNKILLLVALLFPVVALSDEPERPPIRTFSAPLEQLAALRCAREGYKYYVHLAADKYQCADSNAGIESEAKDAREYLAKLK